MQKLRSTHLCLGCLFAPMLLFFAVSGIWQTLGLHSGTLTWLSTIHTSRNLKIGGLTSSILRDFVVVMSVSFVITTILGVVMALKSDKNRKWAYGCLALGVSGPLAAVLAKILA